MNNQWEIGDRVVFDPIGEENIENGNESHRGMMGTITEPVQDDAHPAPPGYLPHGHMPVRFDRYPDSVSFVPVWNIKLDPESTKGKRRAHRRTFRNTLQNIPRAREGMEARKVWNEQVNLPYTGGPGRNYASAWPRTVDPDRKASRLLTNKRNKNNGLRNINTGLFSGGTKRRKNKRTMKKRTRATRRSNR